MDLWTPAPSITTPNPKPDTNLGMYDLRAYSLERHPEMPRHSSHKHNIAMAGGRERAVHHDNRSKEYWRIVPNLTHATTKKRASAKRPTMATNSMATLQPASLARCESSSATTSQRVPHDAAKRHTNPHSTQQSGTHRGHQWTHEGNIRMCIS